MKEIKSWQIYHASLQIIEQIQRRVSLKQHPELRWLEDLGSAAVLAAAMVIGDKEKPVDAPCD